MEIPLSRPDITESERHAVYEVMLGHQLSLGPKVPEFERAFAEHTGMRFAAAVNSGTSALQLCVQAMGIGPGDEVITTPFSFVASSNCILSAGARPVFADIKPDTWNIDPAAVAAAITSRTRAILPVDVFGQTAEMDPIRKVADKHKLKIIEDSCEALGATYKGRPAGSLGDAGVFGFYPNKQVTTGEGGMLVTNNEQLHCDVVSMRNQGRSPGGGWLAHERMGYNYRLSDINCALGIAQMKRLEQILDNRRRVAELYLERLHDERRVQLQQIHPDCRISWFVMVVRLSDDYTRADRDSIMEILRDDRIACNDYFTPIHLQPFYVEQFGYEPGDFPICEALSDRTIALPFHGRLSESEVDTVCAALRRLL
jgi:perosamine synthetase